MIPHRRIMVNLYWYGLVVVGLFNLLPGCVINCVVLGVARADLGYAVIIFGLVGLVGWRLNDHHKFLGSAAVAGRRKFLGGAIFPLEPPAALDYAAANHAVVAELVDAQR